MRANNESSVRELVLNATRSYFFETPKEERIGGAR